MGKGSAKREIGTMRKMRTERKRRIVSNIELWIGFMVVDVVMVAAYWLARRWIYETRARGKRGNV